MDIVLLLRTGYVQLEELPDDAPTTGSIIRPNAAPSALCRARVVALASDVSGFTAGDAVIVQRSAGIRHESTSGAQSWFVRDDSHAIIGVVQP